MHNEFTAIVEKGGKWFIAYCAEIPGANGQGRTKGECLKSLAEAIELILEDRREDALRGAPKKASCEMVKRQALLKHLRLYGCYLKREGRSHSL